MVSVVIPTFNRSRRLVRAIESVLKQSLSDWELLVVDDGSTDETPELARAFNDSRVRWFRQANRGVSAARNLGIHEARFDWIAFLDSDDLWHRQKLERQLQALEASPGYRLVHCDEVWIRRGRRVNPRKVHRKRGGWIFRYCLERCVVSPSSVLLHRPLLEELGGFDESLPVCEDYDLWLRICCRRPVLFLPEKLVTKTGGHDDQLSSSVWGLDRFRLRALVALDESAVLTPQQRVWTAREMVRKALILAAGCRKRGNDSEADRYERLAGLWGMLERTYRRPRL